MGYSTKPNSNGGFDVVSDQGSVARWASSQGEADMIALNLNRPPEQQISSTPNTGTGSEPIDHSSSTVSTKGGGYGALWFIPIIEVVFVILGIVLHSVLEAVLLPNVILGAFGLIVLTAVVFRGDLKKRVLLLWIPTVVLGYLGFTAVRLWGDFLAWLALIGIGFAIYITYLLVSGRGGSKR